MFPYCGRIFEIIWNPEKLFDILRNPEKIFENIWNPETQNYYLNYKYPRLSKPHEKFSTRRLLFLHILKQEKRFTNPPSSIRYLKMLLWPTPIRWRRGVISLVGACWKRLQRLHLNSMQLLVDQHTSTEDRWFQSCLYQYSLWSTYSLPQQAARYATTYPGPQSQFSKSACPPLKRPLSNSVYQMRWPIPISQKSSHEASLPQSDTAASYSQTSSNLIKCKGE